MSSASPFITPMAVEAWDAWFRWRDLGQLRDLTIDKTWERVVACVTQGQSGNGRDSYRRRLLDAVGKWELLLDERVLKSAGTNSCAWPGDGLVASLNVASYVKAPFTTRAAFDRAAFEDGADLAVRALDDAMSVAQVSAPAHGHLRIGLIGVADALDLLGIAYDSPQGRTQTALVAQALADGCLRGSSAMARDRGSRQPCDAAWQDRARARGTSPDLIASAVRFGLRHDGLTAITSQQRVAWLANDVSDALDPLRSRPCEHAFSCGEGRRCIRSDGYARTLGRQIATTRSYPGAGQVSISAQLQLRAAAQPWIDEPISYPLRVETRPDVDTIAACSAMAQELGLGNFAWRPCDSPVLGEC